MTLREEYRRLHRRRRRLIGAAFARVVDWSSCWETSDVLGASERLSLATVKRRIDRIEMLMHYGTLRPPPHPLIAQIDALIGTATHAASTGSSASARGQ